MAKLTGKKKAEFLRRMARGRKKAARSNPKRKAAKKAKRPKKNARKKLTGAKKAEFLKRMARGRRKAAAKNPKRKTKRKAAKKKTAKRSAARNSTRRAAPRKNKRTKNGRRRKNQEGMEAAERMFEKFHQKAPGRILTYEEYTAYPDAFAEMGRLKELRIHLDSANPNFLLSQFGRDCLAVCTPDGQNIYFVGGDQSIDLEAMGISSNKDIVELGVCKRIIYDTVKGFHDFEQINYFHDFGEENGIKPTLNYDRLSRSLFLASGDYRVERAGIVN